MRKQLLAATLACLIPGLALAAEQTQAPPADRAAAPAKADKHSNADKTKTPADKTAKPADESASPASDTTTAPANPSTDKPADPSTAKPDDSPTPAPDEPR